MRLEDSEDYSALAVPAVVPSAGFGVAAVAAVRRTAVSSDPDGWPACSDLDGRGWVAAVGIERLEVAGWVRWGVAGLDVADTAHSGVVGIVRWAVG